MKIITNNHPRPIVYGFELSEKELKDFDYIDPDEIDSHSFFRYKNEVYDLSEFEAIRFCGWDGVQHDSFFSGIVVKLFGDDIIVGRYYS